MFSQLRARLNQIAATASDPKHIRGMGAALRRELAINAPIDTGQTVEGFINAAIRYTSDGPAKFTLTITNRARFGSSGDAAPRGTIKAFLRDFPQYRSKRTKGVEVLNRQGRWVGEFKAFRPKILGTTAYGWWALSAKARAVLKAERLKGKYGGTPGKAPYMWVQDKGTPEGMAGAAKAGLVGSEGFFIEKALQQFVRDFEVTTLRGFWRQ